MLPEGRGWLLVEFGGESKEESDEKANALIKDLAGTPGVVESKLFDDPEAEEKIWEVRESGLGATAFVPGTADTYEGWEDSAVPSEHLGDYLRGLRRLFQKYGYGCSLYGHFGQGCVHTRIDSDLHSAPGIDAFRSFLDEASDLVLSHGGSLSGEHGDGQSRAELLPKMYGEGSGTGLSRVQVDLGPAWPDEPWQDRRSLPDHVEPPAGDGLPAPAGDHAFAYPEDGGSFAHATVRCVGIGKCRHMSGGVMCPSFMVTRDEEHTTRGRARALFEMMRTEKSELELWKSDEVFGALDLCLSCKGCKAECPVNVDMATYKAEFLSHYYRGRVRPRVAYAMGLIYLWARMASKVPRLANLVTHAPGVSGWVKRAAGIALEREAPRF